MKILHAPVNIAGQASILSQKMKEKGIDSTLLLFVPSKFGYAYDECLHLEKLILPLKIIKVLANFTVCLFKYNIFHFHFAESLLPYNMDLPILRLFGKKVFMTYYGSEVRQADIAYKYTAFKTEELRELMGDDRTDTLKRLRILWTKFFCNDVVLSDSSLEKYAEGKIINRAIDLSKFKPVKQKKKNEITIVHAPSHRGLKGTEYIIEAVDRLINEDYPINFILLEGKPNKEVKRICQNADIIIDQLMLETYGVFAIECLAMNKMVVSHMTSKTLCPIVNSSKETLYDDLKFIMRKAFKGDVRQYVSIFHNADTIAEEYLKLYKG